MKTTLLKRLRKEARDVVRMDLRMYDEKTPYAIQVKVDSTVGWATISRKEEPDEAMAELTYYRREVFYGLVEERWNNRELARMREHINAL